MGIACPQLSVFMYVAQRNDLEAQIARISESRAILSYELNNLMRNEEWYKDPRVKLVQIKDNNFDMEQKRLETNLKAVVTNLEAQEKLVSNNVKEEFGYKLSL